MTAIVHLACALDAPAIAAEFPAFPFDADGLRFTAADAERADWLVMAFHTRAPVTTRTPRERRILVMTEPLTNLPSAFVNQFGIVIAPQQIPAFAGIWHQSHGALASFFARDTSQPGFPALHDYAALLALTPPQKRDAIAVVVSRKTVFPGHRRRLGFLRALKAALGDKLDVYGDGLRQIPVKADAILPYKYHLVLENTVTPSYWTEKLADAYLGFALPVTAGPPDLARWFPSDSFLPIDLDRQAEAIATIRRAIGDNLYDARVGAITEARTRLMRNERLWSVVARVIAAHPNAAPPLAAPVTIAPMPRPGFGRRVVREVSRAYWKIDERIRAAISGNPLAG